MPVIPYHKYIGPGNSVHNGPPVDSDDSIALEHDLAYEKNENIPEADRHAIHDFIGDWSDTGNIHSVVGALGLSAKRGVESLTGQLYPMPKRTAGHSQDTQIPKTPRHEASSSQDSFISGFDPSQQQMEPDSSQDVGGASLQESLRSGLGGPGGASTGGGSMGTDVGNLFKGTLPSGTSFKRTYNKAYRFMIPASLTAWSTQKVNSNLDYSLYKIGSSAYFPLTQTMFYMSPREFYEIVDHMGSFHIDEVNATVHTKGVRAPFTTQSSSIEVANTNLHIPVQDISPLIDHYPITSTLGDDELGAILRGEELFNAKAAVLNINALPWSTEFTNIPAYAETRMYRNRAIVRQPLPIEGGQYPVGYWTPSWPQTQLFVKKEILGTNYLAPAFKFHCKGGTIWKRTAYKMPYRSSYNDGSSQTVPGVDLFNDDSLIALDANVTQGNRIIGGTQDVRAAQLGLQNWARQGIWGQMQPGETPPSPKGLIIAMYNIRNFQNDVVTDTTSAPNGANSIINCTLEIVLECVMHATGTYIAPIYYGLSSLKPMPDWFHPHLTLDSTTANVYKLYPVRGSNLTGHAIISNVQETNGFDSIK
uniref:VP n=1 Tax=Motacilla cinerea parvoviridae sp. TaxID=2794518 RepID=A0A8A4XC69_9VIRU|nr:MAG: VP [Motacilla cinerea parvoviridae sp.]